MKELEHAQQVLSRHGDDLLAVPGVEGVWVGLDREGGVCIRVGTSRPPDRIRPPLPDEIEGVPVVVEYVGSIRAEKGPG